MDIAEKRNIVEDIVKKIQDNSHFYITDIEALNAVDTSSLRKKCFEKDIEIVVVKNTLLKKALEQVDGEYEELYDVLKGNTSVLFCETANVPAKLIKEFRKSGKEKPLLKGAFAEESIYIGDDQLDSLTNIKSREELLGDIITLLQSPIQTLVGSLQSGEKTIAGLVKSLSEKEN
ncbi:MAG: 50S ribosomal protein L10 [Bacteroidales bacterium]|jgi:large subunit ribosomal protein L10|nr:50S ribosomal protein L10 [Bacteroidales bacterium]